jgi:hypothetical protein
MLTACRLFKKLAVPEGLDINVRDEKLDDIQALYEYGTSTDELATYWYFSREIDATILPYQEDDTKQLAGEIEAALGGATELRLSIYDHLCHEKSAVRIPDQNLDWYHFLEEGDYRSLGRRSALLSYELPTDEHWSLAIQKSKDPKLVVRNQTIIHELKNIRAEESSILNCEARRWCAVSNVPYTLHMSNKLTPHANIQRLP